MEMIGQGLLGQVQVIGTALGGKGGCDGISISFGLGVCEGGRVRGVWLEAIEYGGHERG